MSLKKVNNFPPQHYSWEIARHKKRGNKVGKEKGKNMSAQVSIVHNAHNIMVLMNERTDKNNNHEYINTKEYKEIP